MWAWVKIDPSAIRIIALSVYAKDMAENMYRGLWCFLVVILVTVVVSLFTEPKSEKELVGLVRGCTELPSEGDLPLWKRPIFWATVVLVVFIALNILFW